MSAVPRDPLGYAGLRMTADEYLALGETEERYELIDGVVCMSPSATPDHSDAFIEVIGQLRDFARYSGTIRVYAETDVAFAAGTVYRPDIVAYKQDRIPHKPARLTKPPDLVVEVLSPETKPRDLITKRDDYEKFGVAEYWAIDPADGRVRCWVREGESLAERPVSTDRLASTALQGFVLQIAPLRPR